MAFYPTREAVQKLLGFETATRQPNSMQHYSVTVVLFIVITVLGITVRSLGKLYALVGGFAATFLAYILPAMACLVTRRYSVTAPVKQIIDEATVKTPLIHNSSSSSSEDSASDNSIINSEGIPKFGLLDVSAVILLIWGVVVMIFATGGVLFNP
jgi:sodium-coupled neutral amino acid transporter 11